MAAHVTELDVLQRCLRVLQCGPSYEEAVRVAGVLMQLRTGPCRALDESGRQLLEDLLRRAIELAEELKQTKASASRAVTPPLRARTPPPVSAAAAVSAREAGRVVRLASWNLKHLSDTTVLGKNAKKDRSKLMEVLCHFDLVAMQEVTNAQRTLQMLSDELPGRWDFCVSPKVRQLDGRLCPECCAFLWRADRVQCTGPRDPETGRPTGFLATEGDTRTPACHYFHRPPFFSSFRVGELEFVALNAHVTFSGAPLTRQRQAFDQRSSTELEPQPEPELEPEPGLRQAGAQPRHRTGVSAARWVAAAPRVPPTARGRLDPFDGRHLEIENLAAASLLLQEQLRRRPQPQPNHGAAAAVPLVLVMGDLNLDHDDAALSAAASGQG
jgi:hypothetical protein